MSLKKTLAMLMLGIAIAAGGMLARQVFAVTAEADSEQLHNAILDYIAERNPKAPMSALQGFPEVLLAEAGRADIDHCLALAQAEVESDFRPDAVGRAGEIGLFQMLPSTAAALEPLVGKFRRPAPGRRDLGDLADPVVSTRFAMAYLRDIMTRKANVKDALTEYNGGPAGRHPHYY
ncbi:MAG: lytic transglycosylase domain-containing protein, partial [Candidatus Rokuibacteriota bacterium]